MVVFPSVWELLLPNLNWFTVLGVIVIALGVLLFFKGGFLEALGLQTKMVSAVMVFVGCVLIWGVSMFIDYWNSSGGRTIIIGLVITTLIGFIIFWKPKNKK